MTKLLLDVWILSELIEHVGEASWILLQRAKEALSAGQRVLTSVHLAADGVEGRTLEEVWALLVGAKLVWEVPIVIFIIVSLIFFFCVTLFFFFFDGRRLELLHHGRKVLRFLLLFGLDCRSLLLVLEMVVGGIASRAEDAVWLGAGASGVHVRILLLIELALHRCRSDGKRRRRLWLGWIEHWHGRWWHAWQHWTRHETWLRHTITLRLLLHLFVLLLHQFNSFLLRWVGNRLRSILLRDECHLTSHSPAPTTSSKALLHILCGLLVE